MKLSLSIIIIFTCISTLSAQERRHPPENIGSLLNSNKLLMGKSIIQGDIGYAVSKISFENHETGPQEFYRNALKLNLNINPWKDFYIRNTFFVDFYQPDEAPRWLSNYNFQIGYYNWRNKTFSFGYENFQPIRWQNPEVDFFTNIRRGAFFVSYKYELTNPEGKNSLKPFFWDETSKLIISPIIRVHPEYQNQFNEFLGYFKPVSGMNFNYVIVKNIYLETGLFYYPIKGTQLPWDPDFTYGFGIFDYRPFKLNITYGNWINNRLPWREQPQSHGFLNGELNIKFSFAW